MKYIKTINHPLLGKDTEVIWVDNEEQFEKLVQDCKDEARRHLSTNIQPKPTITLISIEAEYCRQFL